MKGTVYIDNEVIGFADFKVIDPSMGGIMGKLMPAANYAKYKKQMQDLYEKRGIAGMGDFNFKIVLEDNTLLAPEGGIGVIDSAEFDEILIESAGIGSDVIERMKSVL